MKSALKSGGLLICLFFGISQSSRSDVPIVPQDISLNFQNTDIDVVLKFFSDVTGNIFIKSDQVRGFVTAAAPNRISAAEGMNILQAVLDVKGYTLLRGPGKIIKILTQSEASQNDLEVRFGKGEFVETGGDRMISQFIALKFISAVDIKAEISPLISKNGNLMTDERTNSLVITDMNSNVRRLLKIIESLDVRPPQVLIEALIMEISLTKETKLGVEWSWLAGFNSKDHRFSETVGQNFDLSSLVTEGLTYSIIRSDQNLRAMLRLLATDQNVNILSTPHILTLNNQPAMIQVGEEVPVLTQTRNLEGGDTIRSFDYKSVAIQLEVTPRINSNREVFMKVHPLVKKILGFNAELNAPILASREAQTSVLVNDGETVVIGGLMKDDRSTSQSKIPILGDIPLIGNLFKTSDKTKEKTELLVFITPRVILNSEEAKNLTIRMESEIKNTQTPHRIDSLASYRLGVFYYREKNYLMAIQEFQTVVETAPDEKLKRKARKWMGKIKKKI